MPQEPKAKKHTPEEQNTAPEAPATPVSTEELIPIPKSQLTEILQKLERLESAADKGRLDHYDNKNKTRELTRIRLNVYEDQTSGTHGVIMAWNMIIDEVEYDRSRGYVEKQIIQLTLEDGQKVEIQYRDFTLGRKRTQEVAEIITRSRNENTGIEMLKVRRLSDQKEFEIDTRFVN